MRTATVFLLTAFLTFGQDTREIINLGIQAFKSAKYGDAVRYFEQAVAQNPSDKTPQLYLGTALMSQYVPGVNSPDNQALAAAADRQFRRVLELDSADQVALESLASLHYNMAQNQQPEEKSRQLAEAAEWYGKLLVANPNSKIAHYSLGVITWAEFYPELMKARTASQMRPEDAGPIRDANARVDLRVRFDSKIADAIRHLETALQLDPEYDDAMAYMNLLVRERADLYDTAEEYRRDVAIADNWVQKALDTKKRKAERASGGVGPTGVPRQIRVGGNVQAAKLIEKPTPQYPPQAVQARIQGVVRFNVLISREGRPLNITLVSGHPLMVPSALEAVRGYRWQPTLLNGEPVEVVTQVDVNFTLQP